MAAVRHLGFQKFAVFFMWPLSACGSASTQNFAEIGQSVDELRPKKAIFKMAVAAILNFKTSNFWSRDCNRVQHLL